MEGTQVESKKSRKVPNLRFPKFEKEWSQTKLINLCTLQRGFDITRATSGDGDFPVYSSSGLSYFHND